jgi:hypothetical protein
MFGVRLSVTAFSNISLCANDHCTNDLYSKWYKYTLFIIATIVVCGVGCTNHRRWRHRRYPRRRRSHSAVTLMADKPFVSIPLKQYMMSCLTALALRQSRYQFCPRIANVCNTIFTQEEQKLFTYGRNYKLHYKLKKLDPEGGPRDRNSS